MSLRSDGPEQALDYEFIKAQLVQKQEGLSSSGFHIVLILFP